MGTRTGIRTFPSGAFHTQDGESSIDEQQTLNKKHQVQENNHQRIELFKKQQNVPFKDQHWEQHQNSIQRNNEEQNSESKDNQENDDGELAGSKFSTLTKNRFVDDILPMKRSINSEQKNIMDTQKMNVAQDDELIDSVSITQYDDLNAKVKIAQDNRSIFSELTEKLTTLQTKNAGNNVKAGAQFVNEDFQFVNDNALYFTNQIYDTEADTQLLDKVPLIERPSIMYHNQKARQHSLGKPKIKKSIFNSKYSLNFSLFPERYSRQDMLKRNHLKTKVNVSLANDQNLIDYFNSLRHIHAQSEQRQRSRDGLRSGASKNLIFAPSSIDFQYQTQYSDAQLNKGITTALSTQASQYYKRAQSSQVGQRIHLNTALDQKSGYLPQNINNSFTDDGTSQYAHLNFQDGIVMHNTQKIRPTTAVGVIRQRKILMSMQRQRQNYPQSEVDKDDSQSLDLKQALQKLIEKKKIDQTDKLDLSLIDKIQSRYPDQYHTEPQKEVSIANDFLAVSDSPTGIQHKSLKSSKIKKFHLNSYQNSSQLQEEITVRLKKRLASNNQVFKLHKQQQNDDVLYENLKQIMEQEENFENQEVNQMKQYELKKLKDKIDNIKQEFFAKKLGTGSTLLNKTFSGHSSNSKMVHILNTSNRMEPMTKGPYLKTENQAKRYKDKELHEQVHGYSHSGSPFDHPYFTWMEGLRKHHSNQKTSEIKTIRKAKEDLEYQRYLAEVNALNLVKDFLSQNRDTLSAEHKNQLINQIVNAQRRIRKMEKFN